MSANPGFGSLKVGQRVKVKGRPDAQGNFQAVEINVKPPDENIALEGKVQAVDPAKNLLRLLNRDFILPNGIELKNIQRQSIALRDIKAGDLVKLKGAYHAGNGGFAPAKVKMQENKGFSVEELQGNIEAINAETNSLQVLGFNVVTSAKTKTEIETADRTRRGERGDRGERGERGDQPRRRLSREG